MIFPLLKSFGNESSNLIASHFSSKRKKTLPLDIPQETSMAQIKEWGHKFIEGFKIDLPSLICEMEEVEKGELPLIKRERRRQGKSSMED